MPKLQLHPRAFFTVLSVCCVVALLNILAPSVRQQVAAQPRVPASPTLIPSPARPIGNLEGVLADSDPWHLTDVPAAASARIADVSLSQRHALALTSSGAVIGWGMATNGELTIPPIGAARAVAAGPATSAVVLTSGVLRYWGNPASLPAVRPTETDFSRVIGCSTHMLAVRKNGIVVPIAPATELLAFPPPVVATTAMRTVACATHTIALAADGTTAQWGTVAGTLDTIPVRAQSDVSQVFIGASPMTNEHDIVAALRIDGTLVVWGAVDALQTPPDARSIDGTTSGCPCLELPNMAALVDVRVTTYGLALVKANRAIRVVPYQSGGDQVPELANDILGLVDNGHGQSLVIRSLPVAPTATHTITRRDQLNLRPATAPSTAGFLRIWGTDPLVDAVPAEARHELLQIAAGAHHIVVLGTNGVVTAWGNNAYGQTDVPDALSIARTEDDPLRVTSIAAGANHTLALLRNKTVVAWGDDAADQASVPAGVTNVIQVVAGIRHSAALRADGSVVVWGDNTYGQRVIPPHSNVVRIAAGGWHTLALIANRTVIGWGRNHAKQLGLPPLNRVVDIRANNEQSLLLLADGSLQVFGSTEHDATRPPDGSFVSIGVTASELLAIGADQHIVGWGYPPAQQPELPVDVYEPFDITGGVAYTAALTRYQTATPTPTVQPNPTRPLLPMLPTLTPRALDTVLALPNPDLTTVSAARVRFSTGITATIGVDGGLDFATDASAVTCVVPISAAEKVVDVAFARDIVALYQDRTVRAWGGCTTDTTTGRVERTETIPAAFRRDIAAVTGRGTHLVLRTTDGRVWSNRVALPALPPIIDAVATAHDVVLMTNTRGLLVFSDAQSTLPLPPSAATKDIADLAAGDAFVLVRTTSGKLSGWGALSQEDIPVAAQEGVVAVNADAQRGYALAQDGSVIAWGEISAALTRDLAAANALYRTIALDVGAARVALHIEPRPGVGTPTPTRFPTTILTPSVTSTPADTNERLAGLIGAYDFSTEQAATSHASAVDANTLVCDRPAECPVIAAGAPSAENQPLSHGVRFSPGAFSALTSTRPINLVGISFTVTAQYERTAAFHNDTVLSLGTPGLRNGFLTLGINAENKPYCSFGSDDLVSPSWSLDTGWHTYACSYNQLTKQRLLFRDGLVVASDTVQTPFAPAPTARLVVGRRNDTLESAAGVIDNVEVYRVALSRPTLVQHAVVSQSDKIASFLFDTALLPSTSPAPFPLLCAAPTDCPALNDDITGLLGPYASLQNTGYQGVLTTALPSYSVSAWVRTHNVLSTTTVLSVTPSTAGGMSLTLDPVQNEFACSSDGNSSPVARVDLALFPAVDMQKWQLYTCTYDSIQGRIGAYINGESGGQTAVTTAAARGTFAIGGTDNPLSGIRSDADIDEVHLYDRVLTHAQVIALYNRARPFQAIASPTPLSAATPTRRFTATATPTAPGPTRPRLTPLPATATVRVPVLPSYTPSLSPTRTRTPSRVPSATTTRTRTSTSTIVAPSSTRTETSTPTASRTPLIITRTWLARPTITPTPTITLTASQTPTRTHTPTSTRTYTVTRTPTETATETATDTPTETPTETPPTTPTP